MTRWKIAGINFDHFHMGDLLRFAREHPRAELVGISDEKPVRMDPRDAPRADVDDQLAANIWNLKVEEFEISKWGNESSAKTNAPLTLLSSGAMLRLTTIKRSIMGRRRLLSSV